MHESVMHFGRRHLTAEAVKGQRVIELGSLDVNGSLRCVVEPLGPSSYLGVDQVDGPGVDRVADIADVTGRAGVVLCTEVLEHAEGWRAVAMKSMTLAAPGGLLLITTRSPGFPYHAYPGDHWRFTVGDFGAIFAGLEAVEVVEDPQVGHPGVLACYRRPKGFKPADLSAVDVEEAPSQ